MESGALGDGAPASSVVLPGHAEFSSAFASADLGQVVSARVGWRIGFRAALIVSDTAVVGASLLFAQSVRFGLGPVTAVRVMHLYDLVGFAIGVVWLVALAWRRTRELRHLGHGTTEYQRVAIATVAAFGAVAVAALLLKFDVARGYLLVALPVGLVALLAERFSWRVWLSARRREGRCLVDAFVIGNHQDATLVTNQLVKHRHAGYRPIGVAYTDGTRGAAVTAIGNDTLAIVDVGTLLTTSTEAHQGVIRSLVAARAIAEPSLNTAVLGLAKARGKLDGTQAETDLTLQNGMISTLPDQNDFMPYSRTAAQTLAVYFVSKSAPSSGGFFPAGVNSAVVTSR